MLAICVSRGSNGLLKFLLAGSLLLTAGAATSSAAVIMIDDFSSETLSPEYVKSVTVMGSDGLADVTFDTTTNPGKLTAIPTTTSTKTWQIALLRDDYRLLNDGDWVQVTAKIKEDSVVNSQFLGGLYLNTKGATLNASQFQVFLRGSRALFISPNQSVANAITAVNDPIILRATRLSATSLRASYSVDGGTTFINAGNPVTVPDVSQWGIGVQLGNLNNATLSGAFLFDDLMMNDNSPTPGDFDGDGDVDGADFVAWQTNFPLTSGATLAGGDADADGDVDGADFDAWQTHFPSMQGSLTPVPEPAAMVIAVIGSIGCVRLCRRNGVTS